MKPASLHRPQGGFSLIQLSILLTVAAMVMVAMLPGQEAGDSTIKSANTMTKLMKIEQMTSGFMTAYGRRPCPADGQYDINTANFGIEGANPGTCTGGTPAAPFGPDTGTGNVVAGVIPTKTLGLSDDYAFDEMGQADHLCRRQAGHVGFRLLGAAELPTNNGTGGVTINATTGGATIANTMVAYVSHGADGHGAWPMAGGGGLTSAQGLARRKLCWAFKNEGP